ncbi:MAG TPA: HprK-related kinase A [Candidatus Binatia bacterium]|nr:HprK-related kinase A [Candidatus Binatia bacterium]
MRIAELDASDLAARLAAPGLRMATGPFVAEVRTDIDILFEGIRVLYADFTVAEVADFADFHMTFGRPRSLRRWFYPQVCFLFDDQSPFQPLPLNQAPAMFEWCFNWCISSCANQYLIVHAAAVERDGYAAILPGPPGSGKSTLCAALVDRGWRLLTDELVLVSMETGHVIALARPIALKNHAIELIGSFVSGAVFGPECRDTLKGRVAHLRPPTTSVVRASEPAKPAWLVFPKYSGERVAGARPVPKGQAFMRLAASAFNYTLHGANGFATLSSMIDRMACYDFEYSSLDEAVDWFDNLKRLNDPMAGDERGSFDS